MYFHKISNALGMQCIVAVSSVKQMLMALRLPGIRAVSINNRDMATWALHPSRVDNILGDPEGEETWLFVGMRYLFANQLTGLSPRTALIVRFIKV